MLITIPAFFQQLPNVIQKHMRYPVHEDLSRQCSNALGVTLTVFQSGYFSLWFVPGKFRKLKINTENQRILKRFIITFQCIKIQMQYWGKTTMKFNNKKSIIFYFVESVEQTPRLLRFKNMLISENVGLPCSSRFQHSSNSSQMSLSQCSGWESST